MQIIKKFTAGIVSAMMLTTSVFAASYTNEADSLNKLGLFRGTEDGYELESTFTRAEAATMLTRLLAKEGQALSQNATGIFSDVSADHWAAPYIEYCYNNSITKGTGENEYSPETPISGSEYMTLVMRALGYEKSEPENVDLVAPEFGLMSSKTAREYVQIPMLDRDRMVNISHRALSVKTPQGKTLIQKLIDEGAVDKTTAKSLKLID